MSETAQITNDTDNSHSEGHGKNRYDDIPIGAVLYYGAIAVICTLLAFLFVKGLLNFMTANFEAKRQAEIVETPSNIEVAKQKSLLDGGEKTISIEDASKKMLEKYGTTK